MNRQINDTDYRPECMEYFETVSMIFYCNDKKNYRHFFFKKLSIDELKIGTLRCNYFSI